MFMGGITAEQPVRRRPCPDDFALVFVQIGRLACEEQYRAERDTITRWLEECGKEKLIEQRKAFVHWKRKLQARGKQNWKRGSRRDSTVPYPMVVEAHRYLKHAIPRSVVIGPLNQAELVAYAASLGFDPASTLSPAHVLRQIWARP